MPSFAITRWDGEVHVVEAASVQDAGNTYGWPGNGTIEPYDPALHAEKTTARFANIGEHAAFLASEDYQSAQLAKVSKADKAATKAADSAPAGASTEEIQALVDAAVAKALADKADTKADASGSDAADTKADTKGSK